MEIFERISSQLPNPIDLSENKFFSKKNIITFLVIGIGLLVIPFSVKMVQQSNIFKIRATGEEITFIPGVNVACDESGNCKASGTSFEVLLKSPLGPPGTPAPAQSPTSTPLPTGEPTVTPGLLTPTVTSTQATPTSAPGPNPTATPTSVPPSATPIPTPVPYPTPTTPPGGWACNATYTLNPASPVSGSNFLINVSSTTPNLRCVVLYNDGQPVPCSFGSAPGIYDCTANGGNVGRHVLQLKFGQAASYPGVACDQAVDCSFQTYQTR